MFPKGGLLAISLVVLIVGDYAAGQLTFTQVDATDPTNVNMVREALTKIGVSPDSYLLKDLWQRMAFLGWTYKATLLKDGFNCFFQFDYKEIGGVSVNTPPECDLNGMRRLSNRRRVASRRRLSRQ